MLFNNRKSVKVLLSGELKGEVYIKVNIYIVLNYIDIARVVKFESEASYE